MGRLRDGDAVFDEQGNVCQVVAAHPVRVGRPCFRVVFSDGSAIIADADHLWTTIDRRTRKALRRRVPGAKSVKPQCRPRYAPQTLTTAEIAATLYDGDEVNHCIPCALPLRLSQRDLPLDPYLLGLWLGDGSSSAAEITTADPEVVTAFRDAGYGLTRYGASGRSTTYGIVSIDQRRRSPSTGRYEAESSGFHCGLKSLGLFGNKHVPAQYLRASAEQRLALLQGLFDSDGYCDPANGSSEFCSTSESLALQVCELCLSLGLKAVVYRGRATLCGVDCGPKFRVCFTVHADFHLFRLVRKQSALPSRGAQFHRAYRRYIVAVEPVESVPVRCITVDSASRLYLAGEAMIPTHNTRVGAQWTIGVAKAAVSRIALVAATADDVRGTMVEGQSGILACSPPWFTPVWEPSVGKAGRLTWPNGSQAFGYSSKVPSAFRGPQHHAAWCDEMAAWRRMQETWDMLRMGLRLGSAPQTCITTTPTPAKLIKDLVSDHRRMPDGGALVRVVRGATFANAANLAPDFLAELKAKYEGTRLGRQELYAEILSDKPGALWTLSRLDELRCKGDPPPMRRIVVAIDPPASSGETADECGIVAAGLGEDGHGYVIADHSERALSPVEWARKAVNLYHKLEADRIVAEVNQGGDMVGAVIRQVDAGVSFKAVRAGRSKGTRAEPVSALYEQGRVHHVGSFKLLEDQMCDFTIDGTKGYSPDRVDALVWALSELMLGRSITFHGVH